MDVCLSKKEDVTEQQKRNHRKGQVGICQNCYGRRYYNGFPCNVCNGKGHSIYTTQFTM